MRYEEAFFSELNKVAQEAYSGYEPVTMPLAPASILKSPKLQKAVGVGKKVGMTGLRVADAFLRDPVKSFSHQPSVPRSLL